MRAVVPPQLTSQRFPRHQQWRAWISAAVVALGSTTYTSCREGFSGQRPPPMRVPHGMAGSSAPVGAGMLRAVWQVNHPPTVADVEISDSKFVCGPSTDICARAYDVDGDPIELALDPSGDCTVTEQQATEPSSGQDAGEPDTTRKCWTLACHQLGKIDLKVQVHDLVEREGKLVRIEELIETAGGRSHGELAFFVYFDGTLMWPDRDLDGQGQRDALAEITCHDQPMPGWAGNRDDCDDTDPATFTGALEICRDRKDNNCNGLTDEKCIVRGPGRHP
jgi:hypothetical protein